MQWKLVSPKKFSGGAAKIYESKLVACKIKRLVKELLEKMLLDRFVPDLKNVDKRFNERNLYEEKLPMWQSNGKKG